MTHQSAQQLSLASLSLCDLGANSCCPDYQLDLGSDDDHPFNGQQLSKLLTVFFFTNYSGKSFIEVI